MRETAWIIHAGAIGDFVLALSVIQAVRRAGYESICMLGGSLHAEIAGDAEGVSAWANLDATPWHRLFGDEPGEAVRALVASGTPALVLDMLGVSETCARALKDAGIGRVIQIDARPQSDSHEHITQQWRNVIAAQGLELDIQPARIHVVDRQRDHDRMLVHVGSGGLRKCWPVDAWLDVARAVRQEGVKVVFPLGPVELERWEGSPTLDKLSATGQLLKVPSIQAMKQCLAEAALFCGNDSGISHLAAAVGAPTGVVFGATSPHVWRPLGDHVEVVGEQGAWPQVEAVIEVVRRLRDRGR